MPIPDTVLTALAEHFKSVESATARDEQGRAHELVFANNKGGPISRTWFHRAVWSPSLAHLWPDSEDRTRFVVEQALLGLTGAGTERPATAP